MSEHTPGPWRTDPNTGHERVMAANRLVADCAIWGRGPGFKQEKNQANARLIAAAPSMLETMRWALAECRNLNPGEAGELLEEAIAEAEGRV